MMRTTGGNTDFHGLPMRMTAVMVACLVQLAPLAAQDGTKRTARPSTAAAAGLVTVVGPGSGAARERASAGARFDRAGGPGMTAVERGAARNSRLWKRLNAGGGGARRLTHLTTPRFGLAQPGPGSLRAGTLRVVTEPAGATVYVDGRVVGRSPVEVPNLRRGEHEVRVVRSAYRTAFRDVTLGERDETVRVTLNPLVSESGGVSPWAWVGVGVLTYLAISNYLERKKQGS